MRERTYKMIYHSPMGEILLCGSVDFLTGLYIYGQTGFERARNTVGNFSADTPVFKQTVRWLDVYFSGECPDFTPPLRFDEGSDFRKEVWAQLLEIPYGQTVTYGWIADKIARARGMNRMSAQAVGGAVRSNPISIIVPCHRVIGVHRSLVGYNGGISMKTFLLNLEKPKPDKI